MSIVILDANGTPNVVASRKHILPGEVLVQVFTGFRHNELAHACADILGS